MDPNRKITKKFESKAITDKLGNKEFLVTAKLFLKNPNVPC